MPTRCGNAHPVIRTMDIEDIAAIVHAWAARTPLIRRAYIYGSRVNGTHGPASDIDIAVEFDVPQGEERDLVWGDNWRVWHAELQHEIPHKVHLECADPVCEPTVWCYIQRGGRVVYERGAPKGPESAPFGGDFGCGDRAKKGGRGFQG